VRKKEVKALTRPPSLDDFLPILIYTVIQASPHNLLLNARFIGETRSPELLQGEPHYYLTTIESAIEVVEHLDSSGLSISQEEFERGILDGQRRVDAVVAAESRHGGPSAPLGVAAAAPSAPTAVPTPSPTASSSESDAFAKRFAFLQTEAADLRIGDVPKLLHEYKQVVHAYIKLQEATRRSNGSAK
jgi:hypothetical protein